ncbi:MAG: E3 ubiquitin-protein ligase BRE1A [Paramarteilia canceri]
MSGLTTQGNAAGIEDIETNTKLQQSTRSVQIKASSLAQETLNEVQILIPMCRPEVSMKEIDTEILRFQNKKLNELIAHYKILQNRITNQKESLDQENDRLKSQLHNINVSLSDFDSLVLKIVSKVHGVNSYVAENLKSNEIVDIASEIAGDVVIENTNLNNKIIEHSNKSDTKEDNTYNILSIPSDLSIIKSEYGLKKCTVDKFNEEMHSFFDNQMKFYSMLVVRLKELASSLLLNSRMQNLSSSDANDSDDINLDYQPPLPETDISPKPCSYKPLTNKIEDFLENTLSSATNAENKINEIILKMNDNLKNNCKDLNDFNETTEEVRKIDYLEIKNKEFEKVIQKLETDIEFKEQKIIKNESMLNENEQTIYNLRLKIDSLIHLEKKKSIDGLTDLDDIAEKSDIIEEIKSLKVLNEKYQNEIKELEKDNLHNQNTLRELEISKTFLNNDEMKKQPLYNQINSFLTSIIDDKAEMEKFYMNNLPLYHSELQSFDNILFGLKNEFKDVQSSLVEKNLLLEEQLSKNNEELSIATQDFNNILIATDQLKQENSELRSLLSQINVQKKHFQAEILRLKSEILELNSFSKSNSFQKKEDFESNSLTEISPGSFMKYLDGLMELKLLKDFNRLEEGETVLKHEHNLNNSSSNLHSSINHLELVSYFHQAIQKMRLFIKLNMHGNNSTLSSFNSNVRYKINQENRRQDMLLAELEITGKAFEELQEANINLIEQLKQKDEANFKIIADYTKLESLYAVQKEKLHETMTLLENAKIDSSLQIDIINKIQNQNEILTAQSSELESSLKNSLLDESNWENKINKVNMQINELHGELESQKMSAELLKTSLLQAESDLSTERAAKRKILAQLHSLQSRKKRNNKTRLINSEEPSSKLAKDENKNPDEIKSDEEEEDILILLEEIKEYKRLLTCPCCNFRRKNAILTRCAHVFCLECLTLSYETRQRKCPRCNTIFGPNDFKKIYLE